MNNDVILDAGLLHRLEEIENHCLRTQAIYQYACEVRDEHGVGYFSTEKFMQFMDHVKNAGSGVTIMISSSRWSIEFHWGPHGNLGKSVHIEFKNTGGIKMFSHGLKDSSINPSRWHTIKEVLTIIDKTVPKNVVKVDVSA